jgi:hypothetical protein
MRHRCSPRSHMRFCSHRRPSSDRTTQGRGLRGGALHDMQGEMHLDPGASLYVLAIHQNVSPLSVLVADEGAPRPRRNRGTLYQTDDLASCSLLVRILVLSHHSICRNPVPGSHTIGLSTSSYHSARRTTARSTHMLWHYVPSAWLEACHATSY